MKETYAQKLARENIEKAIADLRNATIPRLDAVEGEVKRLAQMQGILAEGTPGAMALDGIVPGQVWRARPKPGVLRPYLVRVEILDLLSHRRVRVRKLYVDGRQDIGIMKVRYLRARFGLEAKRK